MAKRGCRMGTGNPAIAWKLDFDIAQSVFNIHWTWCYADETTAKIKVPETWQFKLPQEPGFSRDRFGASETRGLLGGVPSSRLQKLSEQSERAIGDVLTYALCQVIDFIGLERDADLTRVFVFGPALPKVVGRFCSLRLPESVAIAWICPVPFPDWIASRGDELLLIPQRHLTMEASQGFGAGAESWEQEALVNGFKWAANENSYVVQHLCNRSYSNPVEELQLGRLSQVEAVFARTRLSREIVAAAGQVEVHATTPYSRESEQSLRPHDGSRFANEVFEEGVKCRSAENVLTWTVPWKV